MERFQLHCSDLEMAAKCGEQFRRRRIEGEKIAPGVALLIGSKTHVAVAADLSHKMATGSLLGDEEVAQIARDAAQIEEEIKLEDGQSLAAAKGEIIDGAVALATLHHKAVAPEIEPVAVERSFVLDVGGTDLQFVGTIDIEEAHDIRDTKTAGKSPDADAARDSIQLTGYAMASHAEKGVMPRSVKLDYLVKTKTPKAVTITATREVADFAPLMQRIAMIARMIETGIFPPAPPSAWWCSERFCGYYSTCPYVRAVTVPVNGGRS